MKWIKVSALAACASVMAAAGVIRATALHDPNVAARTLVEQCASIKKGDKVMISGRPTDMALLESIAVQVRKLGAFPLVTVSTDTMARRMFDEVPAEFDAQTDAFGLKLAETVDAMITVESIENPALLAGVSPARTAARAKAGLPVMDTLLKKNVRQITLGNGLFPTQATASMYGLTTEQLYDTFWSGVNVDYSALQSTGAKVKGVFESGKKVQITNPNGTSLSFDIERRPCFVSDGAISKEDMAKGGAACQVWLPAGEVFSTPVPGTASGRIVFDRVFFEGKEITGVTIELKSGKVTSMTGSAGFEAIKAQYDAAGAGKDEFSMFDIGINPAVKLPAGTKLLSWVPAGMVSLGIGGNTWAGGSNDCPYAFSGFMPGSTVTVDGKPLVEKGTLLH